MIPANVIFPAFTAPYVAFAVFPLVALAAILAEILIFKISLRDLSWLKVSLIAILANVVSAVVGNWIAATYLPNGFVTKVVGHGITSETVLAIGPDYNRFALYGFGVAFVLSVLIEFGIWKAFLWKFPWKRVLWATVLAHWGSYVICLLLFLALGGFK